MKTLSKTLSSFISVILFVSGGFGTKYDELPKAEQVFAWYIESTGGIASYDKIKNRVTKSTLEILNQAIKLNLTSKQAKPNKLHLITESDLIGKIETGTNGDIAWEISTMNGAQIKEGKERINFLHLNVFDRFVYWQKVYKKIETIATEKVNDTPCFKVIATPKEEELSPQTLYFDQKTKFLVKIEITIENPMGQIPVESYFSDYKSVDGIKIPHKNVIKMMSQERESIVQQVEHNVDLPADCFDIPADIKAILEKK